MTVRFDDDNKGKRFFRSSERICRVNDHWYFASREGDQGPFGSESEVRLNLQRYTDAMFELAKMQERERNPVIELQELNFERRLLLEAESLFDTEEPVTSHGGLLN